MKSFKQFLTEEAEESFDGGKPFKSRIVRRPTAQSIDPAFRALDLSTEYANFPSDQSATERYVNVAKEIHKLESSENPNERSYYNWWMDVVEDPGLRNRDKIRELRKISGYLVAAKRGELFPAAITQDATELKPRKLNLSTTLFKDPEQRKKPGGKLVPLSGEAEELHTALGNIPHYREVLERPEQTTIIPSASVKSKILNITRPFHVTPSHY
jgi:hypothetical protein